MDIVLLTHTPEPAKAIAAASLNMGIGRSVYDINEISDAEAEDSIKEIFKSHLTAPLEYASFNFLWEDIPLFMRAHLVRHRVGWSYAERSLRFFDATKDVPLFAYDWDAFPSIFDSNDNSKVATRTVLKGRSLKEVSLGEMQRQMDIYRLLIEEGVSQEDARNIIGVWFPTTMQTACTFRALRDTLAARLSSQAHPMWRKAANEIKEAIHKISPALAAGLVDICELSGRCVWRSRFDRDCEDCIRRGWATRHEHKWTRSTAIFGENSQCDCGEMKPLMLEAGE